MKPALVENPSAIGFESATHHPVPTEVAVEGTVPAWLRGVFLHTGPALFELPARSYTHWFDGLAMLAAVEIDGRRMTYRSRFLESDAYLAARERGAPVFGEFGTTPPQSRVKKLIETLRPTKLTDNANVNVVDLGGRVIAMTETSRHVELDPTTLETIGELRYEDDLEGEVSTAHPHVDAEQQTLINVLVHYGRHSMINIYELALGTIARRLVGSVPNERPSYMHSFATTEHYVVLAEIPLIVNPLELRFARRPYIERYEWRPELGTRIRIVRKQDGAVAATAVAPPCFLFHHVNAFEHDGRIELDMLTFPDPSVIDTLRLDTLRSASPRTLSARFVRLSIRDDLHGQRIEPVSLTDIGTELVRINPHNERRAYRYAYGVVQNDPRGFFDGIAKFDLEAGSVQQFTHPDWYVTEPLFVPSLDARSEDEGVVLVLTLDARTQTSRVVLLDAASMELMANAPLPQRIPFHFHGQFLARATPA